MSTSTLTLTYEQVLDLVKQLSYSCQAELVGFLIESRWGSLDQFTKDGEEHGRLLAWKRGKDWDNMNDEERLDFINDIVHEDRKVRGRVYKD
ncbi:hypothetical protein PCC7805_00490 [Planktothrix agardhii]|uniref:Uncharacterized protein n=1 Tax=Planktothrix agardhii TaxID=1160 RepID=A0A1J1JM55_PLAAG|nr:hypothetical protein [Planktothrix agardhii]MCF3574130.1 hypothetical protein [Planktothrix agardhii 1812]MCF3582432.1 hypothetical protein [Planktothrix agardhii 1811]MCF3627322.1 hypothetical protein [Planktothrix agardhii 1801]CAD5918290.1 hypothetical protein PCC7805_00490 [Planktothrix agardhii]CUM61809.1 conserved protein of unknown function [Planktothrix agardhii]